jgi:HK97 family phage prohead protease
MDRLFIPTDLKADDTGEISGIAWKFGVPDRIGDDIEPGAFKSASLPLPMLAFHDMSAPIGTWDTATEKAGGYHLTGKLLINDVARAREVHALVKAGAVKGLSIGFITKKAVARAGGGRTIKALDLHEVSLVTVPMHPGARVISAKSAVEALSLVAMLNRATAALSTGA